MKFLNILFYAIWLVILAVLQPTLIRWLGIFDISPNIFMIFIVAAAFIRGKGAGAVCGLVLGFVLDLMVGRLIGVYALIFMYAGLAAGILCERYISASGSIAAGIVIFAASLICGILYYIAYSMMWGDMGFFRAIYRVILPEALYTGVLGMLVFAPIRKSFRLISKRNVL